MRKLARFILWRPVLWASAKFSSRPKRDKIFSALTALSKAILEEPGKKGLVIPFEHHAGKFIIFSDQHKGAKNGADDFAQAEENYLAALKHYSEQDFCFINLGDSEELWENSIRRVKKENQRSFEAEKKFLEHNHYVKIFGNHDLYWDTSPLAGWYLKTIFHEKLKVYEGALLKTLVNDRELTIFLTHGHQGDSQSDGNWFSKFFVAYIWAPLQALLRINPNTPAYDAEKKTLHNNLMYEWASQQPGTLLVTGHTHQPVFTSLTHLERLYRQLQWALLEKNDVKAGEARAEILKREREFTSVALDYMTMKPCYFNTGCCCFNDGDITGIELDQGEIRLVKWTGPPGRSERQELEKISLEELVLQL